MTTRREFIYLLSLMGAGKAFAFPIERVLGPAQPAYIQEYFRRMWTWYAAEFFDLDKALRAEERALLREWRANLNSWGETISGTQSFDHFLFSHRAEGDHVDHARFAIGRKEWPVAMKNAAEGVLRKRGLRLLEDFYGVGWNFAREEFKVYALHADNARVADPELREWGKSCVDPVWEPRRISCLTYKAGKVTKRKLIVPLKTWDWQQIQPPPALDILAGMKILEGPGQSRWHFRLRSFFFPVVNESAWPALSKHAGEFQQRTASMIIEDKNHYAAYFP